MKIVFSTIIALAIIIMAGGLASAGASALPVQMDSPFDVNHDGSIDSVDGMALHMADITCRGQQAPYSDGLCDVGDVDLDGDVDALDNAHWFPRYASEGQCNLGNYCYQHSPFDTNLDGAIDSLDITDVFMHSIFNDAEYDTNYDFNNDGVVDVYEIQSIAVRFGEVLVKDGQLNSRYFPN